MQNMQNMHNMHIFGQLPGHPLIQALPISQGQFINFIFPTFEMVRSAKISISTVRGSTSGGTRSFLRQNLLKHCIQLVRKHGGMI
jgi:hypothetical protein